MNHFLKILYNLLTFRVDKFYLTITGQSQILFRWKENAFFRVVLRRDVFVRLSITLAAWVFGAGVMGIVLSNNANPVNDTAVIAILIGFGAALFGGPVTLFLFFRGKSLAGNVLVREDQIERGTREYWGPSLGTWVFTETWPYEVINACRIVPAKVIGKRFSLMIIECYGGVSDLAAIPIQINLQELEKILQSKGVNVEQGTTVPAEDEEGISWFIPIVACVIAFPLLITGLSMMSEKQAGLIPEVVKQEKPERKIEIKKIQPVKVNNPKARAPAPIEKSEVNGFVPEENIQAKIHLKEQNNAGVPDLSEPRVNLGSISKNKPMGNDPPVVDQVKDSLPQYVPPTYIPPSADAPDPSLPQYTPPTYRPPGPSK
ncbi:MAG: hypothetical protein ACKVH8_04245 [Pirellulales bacterium]